MIRAKVTQSAKDYRVSEATYWPIALESVTVKARASLGRIDLVLMLVPPAALSSQVWPTYPGLRDISAYLISS